MRLRVGCAAAVAPDRCVGQALGAERLTSLPPLMDYLPWSLLNRQPAAHGRELFLGEWYLVGAFALGS